MSLQSFWVEGYSSMFQEPCRQNSAILIEFSGGGEGGKRKVFALDPILVVAASQRHCIVEILQ